MKTGRIKDIRRTLKLTQEEFGRKLGVSRSVIVNLELNRAEIKPLFIEHLCSVFNVNRSWLLSGIGAMFLDSSKKAPLDNLTDNYNLDTFDRKLIEAYINLSPLKRQVLKGYFKSVINDIVDNDKAYSEYKEFLSMKRDIPEK